MAVHVRLDERSAAFTALGIGLATGRPAVVLTTSGTAAAELHAAVVEADLARVPIIACTADRPPELHDVGCPPDHRPGTICSAGRSAGSATPGWPTPAAAGDVAVARRPRAVAEADSAGAAGRVRST